MALEQSRPSLPLSVVAVIGAVKANLEEVGNSHPCTYVERASNIAGLPYQISPLIGSENIGVLFDAIEAANQAETVMETAQNGITSAGMVIVMERKVEKLFARLP